MHDVLSHEEYRQIAGDLSLPSNAHINGKFTPAKSGDTFDTYNPATGDLLGRVASCGKEDVGYAVKKAKQAFESGVWSKLDPSERKHRMIRLVKLMTRHRHELGVLESLDSGKPIRDVATIDVPETIECFAWYAEACDKLYDQSAPAKDDSIAIIVREPVGTAACIVPWNFPLQMMAWKAAPALAAGNSVIVKPSSETSMSALYVAELAAEAGIPPGVFNVVPGPGSVVGEAIGMHPDIGAVSFTGSTEVGRRVLEFAARSNLKRVVLELGGKNPAVVLEDAEELDHVADEVIRAVFWNMGENCTSNSRLIVHKRHHDKLVPLLVQKLKEWKTGDPLDPQNALGAIVSTARFDDVLRYIETGKREGARIVTGGEPLTIGEGLFIPPTIFDGVRDHMVIAREEIFGPVLAIMVASTDEQAIELANNTEYGLQASIFCAHGKKALRAARQIKAGTVTINCYGEGDISTPFGGYKLSGFGGRDNGLHAFDQYTETKTIWYDLTDAPVDARVE